MMILKINWKSGSLYRQLQIHDVYVYIYNAMILLHPLMEHTIKWSELEDMIRQIYLKNDTIMVEDDSYYLDQKISNLKSQILKLRDRKREVKRRQKRKKDMDRKRVQNQKRMDKLKRDRQRHFKKK